MTNKSNITEQNNTFADSNQVRDIWIYGTQTDKTKMNWRLWDGE